MVDTTLHTPGVLETSTNEDPFRTPRIRRTLLSVSPRTPTPFKNALKVLNETKLAHVSCLKYLFVNNCIAKMEVGCLKYPGASTICSQPLD